MKTTFKTAILALLMTLGGISAARAGNDKPVDVDQLPAKAQQLIATQFKKKKVALATQERELTGRTYDVVFTDGTKVEFDSKGEWTEIDCKGQEVPAALVPPAIAAHVKKNYPKARIGKIERKRRSYEVDLSNGLELSFDRDFKLTKIDR